MKNLLFAIMISLAFSVSAKPCNCPEDTNENSSVMTADDLSSFFADADAFFGAYVSGGKVDYAAVRSHQSELDALTGTIASASLSAASKDTRIAFYLNAYNISVISGIISNSIPASPLDVKGFFDIKNYTIAGESMTLNDLEGKKLRPDPRVHFSLVCAAKGCPKIMGNAFMPDKVQAQLNAQTKKAMNDADFIRVDDAAKKVQVSQIFDWYKDDFLKGSASVTEFINAYRSAPLPAGYTIEFYTYDWSLNKK
jgi:hypothetical protein